MMLCDHYKSDEKTVGECPECGAGIDDEGETTMETCAYSPLECTFCGFRPCDGSC